MPRRQHLPHDLTPSQVTALQDALLANADRLLQAAVAMLEGDSAPLARSLAILGMEESGKAIALHERRVRMAYATEGEPFIDERLEKVWGNHGLKLEAVHRFLVAEEYWFGVEPSDPEENARVLGAIEEWQRDHNQLKQRGFYVDVSPEGDPVTPKDVADVDAVREVVGHVHQIGWQLRLGEHIEGERRLGIERDVPAATEEQVENMRRVVRNLDPVTAERIVASIREGTKGKKLSNAAYAFALPENPFETVGKPGHEAEDRELRALKGQVDSDVRTGSEETR
ncbi:AbiV family abortive infection protein [Sanguibacter suaedae]|uniref:AbiV family abortive infection protein n=1 Tax=Sanguibacter suaedae TaxID=2795737 RepID=A0A934MET1_9MICO|nr:AbiV family abortive infection protein [Sanguibacter suaedae]MBI9115979.1 AbiV family abortive infection protein [Sanguibacter suaedae]